jgi:hypothetical protein
MEDETIQNDEIITDEFTDDDVETEVVESAEEQIETEADPLRLSPELQSRYKSAAELEQFAATKQSEADRLRNEYNNYKALHPDVGESRPSEMSNEEVLDQLVKDPKGFVNELLAPIAAQVGLNNYANSGHPEIKDPNFMREMEAVIRESPSLVNNPRGLDIAYAYVKSQFDANKLTEAAGIKSARNAGIQTVKKTTAFTEGATAGKTQTSPKITPGMSTAEMDKIFDAQGVGWIKDEDREYD